jgi:hypothetical protein
MIFHNVLVVKPISIATFFTWARNLASLDSSCKCIFKVFVQSYFIFFSPSRIFIPITHPLIKYLPSCTLKKNSIVPKWREELQYEFNADGDIFQIFYFDTIENNSQSKPSNI